MTTKIIKIHGCSGAGKTTAARTLMANSISTQKCYNAARKVEAYKLELLTVEAPVYLLGSYDNNCGGMDTVSSAAAAMELVQKYSNVGHVVHEGLLQSTYYGAMGTDSKRYGDRYIYAFLDTPIELCLERVVARREAMGSTNKFNPQLTRDKHATIERLKKRLVHMGHMVAKIYHDQPYYPQLLGLL